MDPVAFLEENFVVIRPNDQFSMSGVEPFEVDQYMYFCIDQFVHVKILGSFGLGRLVPEVRGCLALPLLKKLVKRNLKFAKAHGIFTDEQHQQWLAKHLRRLLRSAFKAKLVQSRGFRTEVMDSDERILVYASQRDRLAGMGMTGDQFKTWITDNSILPHQILRCMADPSYRPDYMGANMLGLVLMEFRGKLNGVPLEMPEIMPMLLSTAKDGTVGGQTSEETRVEIDKGGQENWVDSDAEVVENGRIPYSSRDSDNYSELFPENESVFDTTVNERETLIDGDSQIICIDEASHSEQDLTENDLQEDDSVRFEGGEGNLSFKDGEPIKAIEAGNAVVACTVSSNMTISSHKSPESQKPMSSTIGDFASDTIENDGNFAALNDLLGGLLDSSEICQLTQAAITNDLDTELDVFSAQKFQAKRRSVEIEGDESDRSSITAESQSGSTSNVIDGANLDEGNEFARIGHGNHSKKKKSKSRGSSSDDGTSINKKRRNSRSRNSKSRERSHAECGKSKSRERSHSKIRKSKSRERSHSKIRKSKSREKSQSKIKKSKTVELGLDAQSTTSDLNLKQSLKQNSLYSVQHISRLRSPLADCGAVEDSPRKTRKLKRKHHRSSRSRSHSVVAESENRVFVSNETRRSRSKDLKSKPVKDSRNTRSEKSKLPDSEDVKSNIERTENHILLNVEQRSTDKCGDKVLQNSSISSENSDRNENILRQSPAHKAFSTKLLQPARSIKSSVVALLPPPVGAPPVSSVVTIPRQFSSTSSFGKTRPFQTKQVFLLPDRISTSRFGKNRPDHLRPSVMRDLSSAATAELLRDDENSPDFIADNEPEIFLPPPKIRSTVAEVKVMMEERRIVYRRRRARTVEKDIKSVVNIVKRDDFREKKKRKRMETNALPKNMSPAPKPVIDFSQIGGGVGYGKPLVKSKEVLSERSLRAYLPRKFIGRYENDNERYLRRYNNYYGRDDDDWTRRRHRSGSLERRNRRRSRSGSSPGRDGRARSHSPSVVPTNYPGRDFRCQRDRYGRVIRPHYYRNERFDYWSRGRRRDREKSRSPSLRLKIRSRFSPSSSSSDGENPFALPSDPSGVAGKWWTDVVLSPTPSPPPSKVRPNSTSGYVESGTDGYPNGLDPLLFANFPGWADEDPETIASQPSHEDIETFGKVSVSVVWTLMNQLVTRVTRYVDNYKQFEHESRKRALVEAQRLSRRRERKARKARRSFTPAYAKMMAAPPPKAIRRGRSSKSRRSRIGEQQMEDPADQSVLSMTSSTERRESVIANRAISMPLQDRSRSRSLTTQPRWHSKGGGRRGPPPSHLRRDPTIPPPSVKEVSWELEPGEVPPPWWKPPGENIPCEVTCSNPDQTNILKNCEIESHKSGPGAGVAAGKVDPIPKLLLNAKGMSALQMYAAKQDGVELDPHTIPISKGIKKSFFSSCTEDVLQLNEVGITPITETTVPDIRPLFTIDERDEFATDDIIFVPNSQLPERPDLRLADSGNKRKAGLPTSFSKTYNDVSAPGCCDSIEGRVRVGWRINQRNKLGHNRQFYPPPSGSARPLFDASSAMLASNCGYPQQPTEMHNLYNRPFGPPPGWFSAAMFSAQTRNVNHSTARRKPLFRQPRVSFDFSGYDQGRLIDPATVIAVNPKTKTRKKLISAMKPVKNLFRSRIEEMQHYASRWKKGGGLSSTGKYESASSSDDDDDSDSDEKTSPVPQSSSAPSRKSLDLAGVNIDEIEWMKEGEVPANEESVESVPNGQSSEVPDPFDKLCSKKTMNSKFRAEVGFEDTSKYNEWLEWYRATHPTVPAENAELEWHRQWFQYYSTVMEQGDATLLDAIMGGVDWSKGEDDRAVEGIVEPGQTLIETEDSDDDDYSKYIPLPLDEGVTMDGGVSFESAGVKYAIGPEKEVGGKKPIIGSNSKEVVSGAAIAEAAIARVKAGNFWD